jgi:hypothetical protein
VNQLNIYISFVSLQFITVRRHAPCPLDVGEIFNIYCQNQNNVPTGGRPNAKYLAVTAGGS